MQSTDPSIPTSTPTPLATDPLPVVQEAAPFVSLVPPAAPVVEAPPLEPPAKQFWPFPGAVPVRSGYSFTSMGPDQIAWRATFGRLSVMASDDFVVITRDGWGRFSGLEADFRRVNVDPAMAKSAQEAASEFMFDVKKLLSL